MKKMNNKQGPVFELFSAVKKNARSEVSQLCKKFSLPINDLERTLNYERRRGFVEKQVLGRLRSFFNKYPTFSEEREYSEFFCGTLEQFAKNYSFYLSLSEKEVALRIIERHDVKPRERKFSDPISRIYQKGELIASSIEKETKLSNEIMEINSLSLHILGKEYDDLKNGRVRPLSFSFGLNVPDWEKIYSKDSYFDNELRGITSIWNCGKENKLLVLKYSNQCTNGICDGGYRASQKFLDALTAKQIEIEYKFR
jgi:hypothetical protein